MTKIKYFGLILSSIFLNLLFSACGNDGGGGCDPDKICYTEKPTVLFADLKLSTRADIDSLRVNYYRGNVDDGDLLISFLTEVSNEYIESPVGNNYSAEAIYYLNDKTIIVVDGHRISARSFTNCEETCWNWDYIEFDMELAD